MSLLVSNNISLIVRTSMRVGRIPRHRHPREDPPEDVGGHPHEDVGVGVDVGVVECGLIRLNVSV